MGYHLYRLNVHIGRHIYASSGVDMATGRFPNHKPSIPPYFEERFMLRHMRSVWEIKASFFQSSHANASELAWPHPHMDGRVQYLATLLDMSEPIVYSRPHHGGPLEPPGYW